MKKEYRELGINEIIVRSRLRSDLGELGTLTSSIRKHGLFSPVIVDNDNILIAGLRRLEACRQAGLTRIPSFKLNTDYRSIDALDIQSDENLCRQPLSQDELEHQIMLKKKVVKGGGFLSIFKKLFSSITGFFNIKNRPKA